MEAAQSPEPSAPAHDSLVESVDPSTVDPPTDLRDNELDELASQPSPVEAPSQSPDHGSPCVCQSILATANGVPPLPVLTINRASTAAPVASDSPLPVFVPPLPTLKKGRFPPRSSSVLKKRSANRWVSALRQPDGSIVSSPSDLCLSFTSFYSLLFSASPTDSATCDSLVHNLSSSLLPHQANLCEGLLPFDECHRALLGIAKRKSPGSDGLHMEFYARFWGVLGHDFVTVLNDCYYTGSLSLSQRRSIISLIFKKGDRLDPRNWHPISLLNVDYKLAAYVLAGRLLRVIHLVVAPNQTCGVPGRFITENVALLRDVVDYATLSNVPIAILSLDQEKAFDCVDWSFMRATLRKMGFAPSFIRWVELFYTNFQSAVSVNGYPIFLFFCCLVEFVKVAPCLLYYMFWSLKSLLPTSVLIHASLVFPSLELRRLSPQSHSMPMTPPSLFVLILPYTLFLTSMHCSKRVPEPKLI